MFWTGWQKATQRQSKIDIKNLTNKTTYTFSLLEKIRRNSLNKLLETESIESVNEDIVQVSS